MLKLTYYKGVDEYRYVTVLGDEKGISDLYWQLTENHKCSDGTGISEVLVSNLDGVDVTDFILCHPFRISTSLSEI